MILLNFFHTNSLSNIVVVPSVLYADFLYMPALDLGKHV